MSTTIMILAAFATGMKHGTTMKPATPSAVPGTAACVAAYMLGWGKGKTEMIKFAATLTAKTATECAALMFDKKETA